MPDVQLVINGTAYSGWKEISVRRSLDLFADTFDLVLTDTAAGAARAIKLGSPCQVRIDGEKLITGYVDRIRPQYSGKSRSITVSGRSKTADLVDCSLPAEILDGAQKNNQTLLQLAQSAGKHFGIEARSDVPDIPLVSISVIEHEQTLFEYLEKHSRTAGVVLVSDPDGNLVITRASEQRIKTALVLGDNIEEADGEFSERDRFSHYYVVGQQAGGDEVHGEAAAHVSGMAADIHVRYRPTTIMADNINLGDAKRYAEWKRNVHYGRSRQVTYTVNGWRHADDLWRPNTNVLVRDAWSGFTGSDGKGEWLMIGTAEFVLDDRGQRTRLTVMPREAYDLIPLPPEDEDEDGGGATL